MSSSRRPSGRAAASSPRRPKLALALFVALFLPYAAKADLKLGLCLEDAACGSDGICLKPVAAASGFFSFFAGGAGQVVANSGTCAQKPSGPACTSNSDCATDQTCFQPYNGSAFTTPLLGAASTIGYCISNVLPSAAPPPAALPTGPPVKVPLITPRLEIPIPTIKFTSPLLEGGVITIPFLAQYVGGVYQFLLGVVGIVAAVMMMIGGFQYLTAGGDSQRVGKAKKRIADALIGMVLAFGSYLVLWTLNPDLVEFRALQIAGVKTELSFSDQILAETGNDADTQIDDNTPAFPPGAFRTRMWESCGAHDAYSQDVVERYKRLAKAITAWYKVGLQEGGAVYVRGGTTSCDSSGGQEYFVTPILIKNHAVSLPSNVTGACRTNLENWRAWVAAGEKKDDPLRDAAVEFSKQNLELCQRCGSYSYAEATPKNDSECHKQYQEAYKRWVVDPSKRNGLMCGDCQGIQWSLYKCLDNGKGRARVSDYVVHGDGKGKCYPAGEDKKDVTEEHYVFRFSRNGDQDVDEYTHDGIAKLIEEKLLPGDVISVVWNVGTKRHTFMYTGKIGLPFEILEMGGGGSGDLKGDCKQVQKNGEIATGVSCMNAHKSAADFFKGRYPERGPGDKPYMTCIWANRPLLKDETEAKTMKTSQTLFPPAINALLGEMKKVVKQEGL